MTRVVLTLSILLNMALLAGALYLTAYDPVVATVTTPEGNIRTVLAGVINKELAKRHGEEVESDLVGRALIDLAADEEHLELDETELESRWQSWLSEPGTRARIDSGEVTEGELRERLVTLVLLDQLTWNDLTLKEQEALMRDYFKANQSDFEQLHLRHIVVESQKDANDIAGRLAAGVDFQELAHRFSLDPLTREQGGDMGWKSRADLTEDLRAFLFLLPAGAASSPVSSPSGWHIFLVEERRETYEDCKDMVRRQLTAQRRPETLDSLRERFKVERSDGEDLQSLLKRPGFLQGSQARAFDVPAKGARPGTQAPSAAPSASSEPANPSTLPRDLASPPGPPLNLPALPNGLPDPKGYPGRAADPGLNFQPPSPGPGSSGVFAPGLPPRKPINSPLARPTP